MRAQRKRKVTFQKIKGHSNHRWNDVADALAAAGAGDGEACREGAANHDHRGMPRDGAGWVTSCSVELCSAAGWEAWVLAVTGGTEFSDAPEYRMLPIRNA